MEMDPSKVRHISTTKSTLYLILAIVLVAAAIGGAAYVFISNPSIMENVLQAIAVIVVAILIIAVAIWLFSLVLGIGYYAKGAEVQTDMSYDIEDVKPVEGKTLEDEKQ